MLTPRNHVPEGTPRTPTGGTTVVVPGGAGRAETKAQAVLGYSASTEVTKLIGGEALPVLYLLVVDDNASVRHACLEIAAKMGYVVVGAPDIGGARSILKHQKIDVMLLDLKLPGGGGLALLEEVKTLHPDTSVVVMTAFATVSSAVSAMRIGAGDYLTKPFALEELTEILTRVGDRRQVDLESRRMRERLRNQRGAGQLIGRSAGMENLYRILSKVARSAHPVLILGESGTGKELVARAIHFNGPHPQKRFVPVDCKSLLPTLIESELFGYVKGAFAGANRSKEGLLVDSGAGTVFLHEISELPLELQAKLLRALQDKEVRPLGATSSVPLSARILAGTSQNLSLMVEQGRFRKDLYFRLNVVNLRIPSLRDRREDIGLLAMHFLERVEKEAGRHYHLSDDALRLLNAYDWPGNVQELENAIERACALSSGPTINVSDLPTALQDFLAHGRSLARDMGREAAEARAGVVEKIVPISEMERVAILATIRQLNGDKLLAAKLLGIGKTTLYRKLKEYGVESAVGTEL